MDLEARVERLERALLGWVKLHTTLLPIPDDLEATKAQLKLDVLEIKKSLNGA